MGGWRAATTVMGCQEADNLRICYLLSFPTPDQEGALEQGRIRGLKDAPYFQAVDIEVRSLAPQVLELQGLSVQVQRQVFDGQIQVNECRFTLPGDLSGAHLPRRLQLQSELRRLLLPPEHQEDGLFEEYIILLVGPIEGTPDEYTDCHAPNLARFIRSQREIFAPNEIEEILVSRVRYSEDELTVVDWEGALLISPAEDFQSDIELLKIGNYQLLRYRKLDQRVESLLRRLHQSYMSKKQRSRLSSPARSTLAQTVQHRLELMLEFERTEQQLLLIGDWYTAKLYKTIHDEFYLDEWKQAVQSKLENLETIVGIIQDNFTLSWQRLLDMVEIAGWFILLVGYFILFFFEISPK